MYTQYMMYKVPSNVIFESQALKHLPKYVCSSQSHLEAWDSIQPVALPLQAHHFLMGT